MSLLGLYRPGTTLWHRLSAGTKLLLLFVLGIVVVVLRGPWSGVALLVVVLGVCTWSRMGLRILVRTLRGLALVSATLAAYLAWQQGVPRAIEVVTDLWTLVLAATVVTSTTPLDQMLDAFVAAMRPLRRVGIESQVTFTGGVARNVAMRQALEERLGFALNLSEESHFMGALGAALFALDRILASRVPAAAGERRATA